MNTDTVASIAAAAADTKYVWTPERYALLLYFTGADSPCRSQEGARHVQWHLVEQRLPGCPKGEAQRHYYNTRHLRGEHIRDRERAKRARAAAPAAPVVAATEVRMTSSLLAELAPPTTHGDLRILHTEPMRTRVARVVVLRGTPYVMAGDVGLIAGYSQSDPTNFARNWASPRLRVGLRDNTLARSNRPVVLLTLAGVQQMLQEDNLHLDALAWLRAKVEPLMRELMAATPPLAQPYAESSSPAPILSPIPEDAMHDDQPASSSSAAPSQAQAMEVDTQDDEDEDPPTKKQKLSPQSSVAEEAADDFDLEKLPPLPAEFEVRDARLARIIKQDLVALHSAATTASKRMTIDTAGSFFVDTARGGVERHPTSVKAFVKQLCAAGYRVEFAAPAKLLVRM